MNRSWRDQSMDLLISKEQMALAARGGPARALPPVFTVHRISYRDRPTPVKT